MTKPSTTSKPSTASATATKRKNKPKNRWFRAAPKTTDRLEFDHLLDHYWGGPERRITGLTVRIMAVNAIALIMLLIGTLYLGQYQTNLIEAKLETFKTKIDLISAALSEGAITENKQLSPEKTRRMIQRFSQTIKGHVMLFDASGTLILDSRKLAGINGTIHITPNNTLHSVEVLKEMAGFVSKIFSNQNPLPLYKEINSTQINDFPDAMRAINGERNLSAWRDENNSIFLTAAAPLKNDTQLIGVILLTKDGRDIEQDINEVWGNIMIAFLITSMLTIMLSIYLSGVIARPLKKLASSAEGVRKGQLNYTDIPDMSARHDEIGELSVALRQMTEALWDRMDSIEGFAADVAHELKNPLTSLRSAIETVSIIKKKSDREKLMAIILHDIERMDRLISDISSASRLDAELSREELQKTDLKQVLHNILDAYKTPLERKNMDSAQWDNSVTIKTVKLSLSSNIDEDIHVWGMEGRLEQIFQNLIANALSFSPEGSDIDIAVNQHLKRVTITIEDKGPGIPENKLITIFERFYSERPKHEDYGKHSGLGLSICKQIITAINGDIFAENIQNEANTTTGTRFTVILNKA